MLATAHWRGQGIDQTDSNETRTEGSYVHPIPLQRDHHSEANKRGRRCMLTSVEVSHVVRMNTLGGVEILTQLTEASQLC